MCLEISWLKKAQPGISIFCSVDSTGWFLQYGEIKLHVLMLGRKLSIDSTSQKLN